MGFIIKKIVVHRKPTPVREGEVHYNMDRASWDVRNLLEVFSREFTHKVSFFSTIGYNDKRQKHFTLVLACRSLVRQALCATYLLVTSLHKYDLLNLLVDLINNRS